MSMETCLEAFAGGIFGFIFSVTFCTVTGFFIYAAWELITEGKLNRLREEEEIKYEYWLKRQAEKPAEKET